MAITTAMATSFKVEMLQAAHCFQGTQTFTGNTHSNFLIDGIASTANVVAGMAVSGTGIPANTVVAFVNNTSAVTISQAASATAPGVSLTFTGDVFKMALIKFGMAGTYGPGTSNYANVTSNSDEASGTGYSAGGVTLTQQSPSNPSGNVAIMTYTVNPSWTSATLDVAGCIIYNSGNRTSVTGRAVSVHDFGGEQKVTNGTLTINMPTADINNAILRIS